MCVCMLLACVCVCCLVLCAQATGMPVRMLIARVCAGCLLVCAHASCMCAHSTCTCMRLPLACASKRCLHACAWYLQHCVCERYLHALVRVSVQESSLWDQFYLHVRLQNPTYPYPGSALAQSAVIRGLPRDSWERFLSIRQAGRWAVLVCACMFACGDT